MDFLIKKNENILIAAISDVKVSVAQGIAPKQIDVFILNSNVFRSLNRAKVIVCADIMRKL